MKLTSQMASSTSLPPAGAGGLLLEGQVPALVAPVLLGAARLDALDVDA